MVRKEKTGNRLVIGSFYGYTFEVPTRGWAHFALERVLEDLEDELRRTRRVMGYAGSA